MLATFISYLLEAAYIFYLFSEGDTMFPASGPYNHVQSMCNQIKQYMFYLFSEGYTLFTANCHYKYVQSMPNQMKQYIN